MAKKKAKVRKNFHFPAELAAWAETYARDHNTTMTQLILDHFTELRKNAETAHAEQI